jgi:long-chain acyl-CoA synthetase
MTYLAFLPLAHILEFVVENSFVFAGLGIGYGKIKTLTDANVRDCKGDIAELKPVSFFLLPSLAPSLPLSLTLSPPSEESE